MITIYFFLLKGFVFEHDNRRWSNCDLNFAKTWCNILLVKLIGRKLQYFFCWIVRHLNTWKGAMFIILSLLGWSMNESFTLSTFQLTLITHEIYERTILYRIWLPSDAVNDTIFYCNVFNTPFYIWGKDDDKLHFLVIRYKYLVANFFLRRCSSKKGFTMKRLWRFDENYKRKLLI